MDPNLQNNPYQRPPLPKDVEPPRQRIDVACSRCRRRKIRCSGYTEEQPRCLGCIKADHPCEFVNRVTPIIVPSNVPHSVGATTIASPGYTRTWSPTSAGSPRGYGSMSSGHRRQGYHPYAQSQPSPTGIGYSPSSTYVVAPWMQQQPQQQSPQDIAESYAGTGFHHLLDPTTSVQPRRSTTDSGLESPSMMAQSSLAQRRLLQREGSYTYGAETQGTSPLPSPLTIPSGISSSSKGGYISSPGLVPREETGYGKLMYAPLQVSSPQLQSSMSSSSIHATQIQNQSPQHIGQKPANFSPISSTSQHSQSSQSFPTPSPQSQTPQYQEQPQQPQMQSQQFQEQQSRVQTQQFQDQQSRMLYHDPSQRMQYTDQSRMHYQDPQQRQQQYLQEPNRPQYPSEFAIPNAPRRPNIADVSNPSSSSTSVMSYSTQSHQSTQSSSVEYPGPTPLSQDYSYSRPTDRYPSPYRPVEPQPRVLSRPASRSDQAASLTPQTLADHTHVQESIHEQHIDAAKNVLAVDNGNNVQVIEYLDTLPQPQPTVPSQDD